MVLFSRALALFALGAVCAFFSACSSSADGKQQKAQAAGPRSVSVAVAPVLRQDVPVYLSGLGAVTAFNTANIKSRVDGQIMKVNFREGQNVKQGELLIEIDSRPFQVQLEQMQAQLFRDQANLTKTYRHDFSPLSVSIWQLCDSPLRRGARSATVRLPAADHHPPK